MPTLVIEVPGKESLEASAPEGGRLLDVCDRIGADVAFSCRSADCGSCLVLAVEGADELFPPSAREMTTLRVLAAPAGHRLACQALLRPGTARLHLRALQGKNPAPGTSNE